MLGAKTVKENINSQKQNVNGGYVATLPVKKDAQLGVF